MPNSRRILVILTASSMVLAACTTDAAIDPASSSSTPTTAPTTASTTAVDATTTTGAEATTTTQPETTTTAVEGTRLEIAYASGEITGGGRLDVPLGDEVVISITSDTADEVHLHGYDIFLDLEAGETRELTFTADIPGIFELELENSRVDLAELQVAP